MTGILFLFLFLCCCLIFIASIIPKTLYHGASLDLLVTLFWKERITSKELDWVPELSLGRIRREPNLPVCRTQNIFGESTVYTHMCSHHSILGESACVEIMLGHEVLFFFFRCFINACVAQTHTCPMPPMICAYFIQLFLQQPVA